MFCFKCGKENIAGNNFCSNCGNNMNESPSNTNIKKSDGNKETSLVLGIICLVSSFFLNIICFIPGIISIVYAIKYKKENGKLGVGFGLSLGGMIFSLIILIIIILLYLTIFNFITDISENIDYDYNPQYTYNLPNV